MRPAELVAPNRAVVCFRSPNRTTLPLRGFSPTWPGQAFRCYAWLHGCAASPIRKGSARAIARVALVFSLVITVTVMGAPSAPAAYDLVVYGGTAGGVIAAIAAANEGLSVLLLEPGRHVGGMVTGGLGRTDHGRREVVGGLSREFFERCGRQNGRAIEWYFEPHVAEKVFRDWLAEAGVTVRIGHRLDRVHQTGSHMDSIVTENGVRVAAKVFMDASYEGDLMARAGVSYTIGREGRDTYGESLAGRRDYCRFHQFAVKVSPRYASGGLMPYVYGGEPGEIGQADQKVQAYNFRLCLTLNQANQVPFPRPANYDPKRYDLLARILEAAPDLKLAALISIRSVANGKTDINNNGAFSTDHIGASWAYPDADYATRERIRQDHVDYVQGFFYFLAHDPQVPPPLQTAVNRWGLAKDEFLDTNHWPHQLYIREARRMIGRYVMVQADLQTRRTKPDSIGMGSYNSDSHHVQRIPTADGAVINEGDMQVPVQPYEIAYRALLPKRTECENLIVIACVSASHVAYSSIRMEPVYMIMGHSAGVAAALAIRNRRSVHDVSIPTLQAKLRAQRQILSWRDPNAIEPVTLDGIVIDDVAAERNGSWRRSRSIGPYVGDGYYHDGNSDKGTTRCRFVPEIRTAGRYEVRIAYTAHPNRASNVPVTIRHADGTTTVRVDQRKPPAHRRLFEPVGTYRFSPTGETWVEITNEGTDGHVIVDAVQWVARP